jgi:DNA-binding transcriptional MerR regulator/methylmalonyl-CoA mutase cobalamin-binding subunit
MVSNAANQRVDEDKSEALYPIRTIAAMTGVNAVTLRAWERRYNLIRPQRTPKGHRLYTRQDIDLINKVVKLVKQGIAISQVGNYLSNQATLDERAQPGEDPWQVYQEHMLSAVHHFDDRALDHIYNDALSLYPASLVTSRLIIPMLKTLGERWDEVEAGIAEEHFFAMFLRNKLGARFHHLNEQGNGPTIVAACIPGEFHEVGLLLFCLSLVSHGFRIVLLGANTPLQDLPVVVARSSAQAIVLSASSRPPRKFFQEQLAPLVTAVRIPVYLGGSASLGYQEQTQAAGAITLGGDYQTAIETLSARLGMRD